MKHREQHICNSMIRFSTVVIFLSVGLPDLPGLPRQDVTHLVPASRSVPASFFGMHIHRAGATTPWPAVPVSEWRLWDAYVTWPYLEPHEGQWRFDVLDRHVALAEQHKVSVLLPLGLSPAWASARPQERAVYQPGSAAEPRDIEAWRTFVQTVVSRYRGRIEAYEIWNEPNLKQFWTGNVDQMLILTREASQIIRRIDPHAIIVSPSPTDSRGLDWLSEFLSKGGGQYVDVIGYHFYVFPKPPEAVLSLIEQVKQIAANNGVAEKPIWNTETGWAYPKPFPSSELAAAYLARAYVLNWAAGVERLYWYAWDNHGWVSIETTQRDDQTLTAAGTAYKIIYERLTDARLEACNKDQDHTWTCELNRNGATQWIVWNPDGATRFAVPDSWHAQIIVPLLGGPTTLSESSLDVGPVPVFVTGSD